MGYVCTRTAAAAFALLCLVATLLPTCVGQLGVNSLETQALLAIAAAFTPTRINSGTIVDTWDPQYDPCNPPANKWLGSAAPGACNQFGPSPIHSGVICNCSSVVANVRYNPCPTGSPRAHVYGLDLSWRSQYIALGFSRLGGWLSPMIANLTQLKMIALANNRYAVAAI